MAGKPPLRFSDIERCAREAAARAASAPQAARAAIAEADAFLKAVSAGTPNIAAKLASLACRKGCDACCHQMVGVTAPEAALLAEAVRSLPPPLRTALVARIKETAHSSAGMGPAEWWKARVACPLLVDGQCAVHDARPLPCRAMNSADAEICRRAFAGDPTAARIPILAAQHGVYGHAQAGLAQAAGGRAMGLAEAMAALL